MPRSAPHRLIAALDRLPQWVDRSPGVRSGRIVALAGAPAINVIPSRATGRVEIVLRGSAEAATTVETLRQALGEDVEVTFSATPCAGDRPAGSDDRP